MALTAKQKGVICGVIPAATLIWASSLPLRWLRAIPVAALLFVIGRMLFTVGYERGAPGRAMGFGLTMYPTAFMLATAVGALLLRMLAWIGMG